MSQPSRDAARLGEPSYVWRAGQRRRLAMIARYGRLDRARTILDAGTGLGLYLEQMREAAPEGAIAVGSEIEWARAREAAERVLALVAAEPLPFPAERFDLILSHEVLEHVGDDRLAVAELVRVLAPGGRLVIFVPNRWWPFETHGIYWRGRYHFGNKPGVNYLPDPLRNRLAPHVRTYTGRSLRALFVGQPVEIVHHGRLFPGYDNVVRRYPRPGALLRRISYALERGPLHRLGLSHLLVVKKRGR